jgi:hypothetical protein
MSHLFDTLNYETNIFQVNILILGEFLVVCMIYLLIDKGGKNNWHRRWIEYRLLAETFRLTMLLLPLGGVAPRLKVPAHDSQDNPANSWVHWHARSVAREAGLPEIQCDAEFRDTYQKHLIGIISEQVEYHKNLSDCGKKVTHCIHTIGMVFFIVILIFCALHLFEGVLKPLLAKLKLGVENWYPPEALSLLITAFLPALGAALAGILTQGEFYRIERRSKAMAEQLQVIVEKLRKDENYSIEQLASLAESAAETIITEVLDWRVVFLAKPLERPT